MRQTTLFYLHVTARLQLINCFKRGTSHELISTHYFNAHNFDGIYQGGSKFVSETRETQTTLIGSFSDQQKPPF